MIVKDIRQFRKWLKLETDNENKDENFIGFSYPYATDSKSETKARGFFNVYHNQAKDIENRLSTVLDMAQDSQAIYEFVQNAVDCNSTAFFMFYEENHFLAINNGDSFNSEGIRAILNFAQSTKSRDENIGKFGVGFKLIHRMVGEGNGLKELTHDYTGPIVFSWSKRQQLDNLLNLNSLSDIKTDSNEHWDESDASWFFKILLTCVPILPNELDSPLKDINYEDRTDLFTKDEFVNFKGFINSIWTENQDKFSNEDLNQGSIFYLNLGKEKEKKLDEDFSFFKKGIQYSLSFVANLMNKKGLKRIYFKNEEPIVKDNIDLTLEEPFIIDKSSAEFNEIKSYLKENDITRNINIVFGYQEFENTNNYGQLRLAPNFYKFFPMGKENCGLNFIIHSNIFEIEASRREFVQKDKRNIFVLEKANKRIQELLTKYQNIDYEKFNNIFLSILFSNQPNSQQDWITNSLYIPLLNYITKNCPTIIPGDYQHSGYVVLKNTHLKIQPSDFGIINRYWFKWSKNEFNSIKNYNGNGKDISYEKIIKNTWNIVDIIREGNLNSIKQWHSTANSEEIGIFNTELVDSWSNVTDTKFWSKLVAIPVIIDLVAESGENKVKYNYVINYPILKLHITQNYTRDSIEYKLLKVAKDVITSNSDIENFRNKTNIVDNENLEHKLNSVSENDKIIFKNNDGKDWTLNLSEVVPSYQSKSGLLGQIITKFEDLDLPLHSFLGVGKQKPNDEIYKLLQNNYQNIVNPSQFVFLGFYSKEKGIDFFQNFNFSDIDVGSILDLYSQEIYPFPTKYAKYIDNFNPKQSVYPYEWAIDKEQLPISIKLWIETGDKERKLDFLSSENIGLNTENGSLIKIRKTFANFSEATQHDLDLVYQKDSDLLLNSLYLIQNKQIVIKNENQISLLRKLFVLIYSKSEYNTSHPQLYINTVNEGDIIEYIFKSNDENDFLLDEISIKEIYNNKITLKQIYDVCVHEGYNIFDVRNYPISKFKDISWNKIEIKNIPDFNRIYQNSWSFDEAFFQDWLDSHDINVLFYQGKMPYLVNFNSTILRKYEQDDYCFNENNGQIFINIPQSLSINEKAEIIVERIKNLPESLLSYNIKNSLNIKYLMWRDGEYFNIDKKRKEKIKNSKEYSFEWLKAIFDWEYDSTVGVRRPILIKFQRVAFENQMILLTECNYETIPNRVEFQSELIEIRLTRKQDVRKITATILNYNEFELKIKVVEQSDIEYLSRFESFSDFKASFRLAGDDVLMDCLRDNLFGANCLVPKNGDIKEYIQTNFSTSKISFLFGPPGTGKTTKLALDILATLCYNHSTTSIKILILTPTNKAADVLIERILELVISEDKLFQVASTYYPAETVTKLVNYSNELLTTNTFKNIFVRYGNSDSSVLRENDILQSKYTLKEIWPNLVLATTVHRLAFDELAGNQLKDTSIGWTHIVIDEASMISLPHAVFSLLQFGSLNEVNNAFGLTTTFTISGDPFQIQPVGVTPNYIEQGIEGLKGWATENIYTLFELTNFSLNRTPVGNYIITKLLTQYRSVPAIGEVFSKFKYDGRINHYKDKNTKDIELGEQHLNNINLISFPVYSETDEHQEKTFKIQKYGEFSAYHIYSIVFACELASAIKLQNPHKSIGVITPYGTQARLIKEISSAFKNQNPLNEFNVSTIHRYQGDESDVIILVMNPPKMNPWEFSHFNNSFLINVGISRAKESLIILHPHQLGGYSEILDGVIPLCEDLLSETCSTFEKILLDGIPKRKNTVQLADLIDVKDFSIFNVCDLKEFSELKKEYLFFADSRDISENEKRYSNVILNLSRRQSIVNYIEPKENKVIIGKITGIHQNNRTAFVKIKNMKERGVIHNNAVSNNFVSDINQILKIGMEITAKIIDINEKGVVLSMKNLN